jgi:hypothetical protein
VSRARSDLASGLISTSQQLGGALRGRGRLDRHSGPSGTLTRAGDSAALAGGLQWAFWVTGVTALVAVAATFLLVRSDEHRHAVKCNRVRHRLGAQMDD